MDQLDSKDQEQRPRDTTGAPLGPPHVPVREGAPSLDPAEKGTAPPTREELKELKKLETLVGKVGHEIKSVLKEGLEERRKHSDPPQSPRVVVHRVEKRVEREKAPRTSPEPETPASAPAEEHGGGAATKAARGRPTFGGGTITAILSGIFLTAFALGALFLWLETGRVKELETRVRAGLERAGRIEQGARLEADSAKRILAGIEAKLDPLGRKVSDLAARKEEWAAFQEEIATWRTTFRQEKEELDRALARLEELGSRRQWEALKESAQEALFRAEAAIQNLGLMGRQIETLARLGGRESLLRARLAGDRWRHDRRSRLGEPLLVPRPHPDEQGKAPRFRVLAGGEGDLRLPTAVTNRIDDQTFLLIPPGTMVLGDEGGDGEPDERCLADPELYGRRPAGPDRVRLTRPRVAKSRLDIEITRPFFVGLTEVTNRSYNRFVRATGHPAPPHWPEGRCPADLLDYPVIQVSWHDARSYCQWADLRLLTEVEWEYCAKSPEAGRAMGKYPWGRGRPTRDLANFDESEPRRALDLEKWRFYLLKAGEGRSGRTRWGLRNLAGNVAEWCADWYRATWYTTLAHADRAGRRDPVGPPYGLGRVVRGGSWYTGRHSLRASARDFASPGAKYPFLGFRCALDAEKVISGIR